MQAAHPGSQLRDRAGIDYHVVGRSQTLRPRSLLGDDGAHLRRWQAAIGDNPANLVLRGTVHYKHAVHARGPVSGFHQQWHGEHDIRRLGSAGGSFCMLPDQWVQDGFESLAFDRIAEHKLPHAGTIEGAGRVDECVAERASYRIDRRPVGLSELMRDDVSIDDGGAVRSKEVCNDRLATADAAGQANSKAPAVRSPGFA